MLFKPLPQNLDAYVVQDHLFQTLKKNKFTQQLLNLRAEEIVKGLLKQCLTQQITQKYHQTRLLLQQTEQKYSKLELEYEKALTKYQKKKINLIKDIKSQHETIIAQTTSELQTKDEHIANLQEQITELEQSLSQLQEQYQAVVEQSASKSQQIQTLTQQKSQLVQKNKSLTNQMQSLRQRSKRQVEDMLFTHQEQMNRNFTKIKTLNNTVLQAQGKIAQLVKQNQQLKDKLSAVSIIDSSKITKHQGDIKKSYRQIEKLRKELAQSEQNYDMLKKQIIKFQDKYKTFQQQYNSMRQRHESQQLQAKQIIEQQQNHIQALQSEIKQLKISNENLTLKNTTTTKAIEKLHRHLSTSLVTLKQQNLTLRSYLKQTFILINQYAQTSLMKVANHISQQVNSYFQQWAFEIKKGRQQKQLARQQIKMKTEIIQHLDRLLDGEVKSVQELKFQLKQKIMQQQKLRRRLKIHYSQTDKRLEEFQEKYMSILRNQF